VVRQTSQQITADLLCAKCEDRFRRNGEEYVIGACCRDEDDFPLSDLLLGSSPYVEREEYKLYDGRRIDGVDVDRLVYFGASVFWRASVNRWRVGWMESVYSHLGERYQERMRLYLMGEAGFPADVAIHLVVGTDRKLRGVVPPCCQRSKGYWSHAFEVPGLQFHLEAGKDMPSYCSGTSFHETGMIYLGDFKDGIFFRKILGLVRRARPSKKMQEWLEKDVPSN